MTLSESDSRAKIIDEIFQKSLGWCEEDITREEHVSEGFVDYVFRIGTRPVFIVEAKKIGTSFTIPFDLKRNRHKLTGPLLSDGNIKDAVEQAQKYSIGSGTTFAIVTNGFQFLIFETFKYGGKWKEGICTVFKSFEDIFNNFTLFWNILSRNAVENGSLRAFISDENQPVEFARVLDSVRSSEEKVGKNFLAGSMTPVIQHVFGDLTDDDKQELLERCYIQQQQMMYTGDTIKARFKEARVSNQPMDISLLGGEGADRGFQVSFDKCREFLRKHESGSTIVLLGGVGSGKTTFLHYFFKVEMKTRKDIIWFYVDFGKSHPNVEKIEQMIFESIVKCYEKHYKASLESLLSNAGMDSVTPDEKSILTMFSLLVFKGYSVSIVLDNVDRLSGGGNIDYQERVFQLSQYFAEKFRTIIIITLREETYFRSKKSGILDAYLIPKFTISSPDFEELLRRRVSYALDFLKKREDEIVRKMHGPLPRREDWWMIKLVFRIVNVSIRKDRRVGKDILRFINDVSGGDMRKALEFFNSYITSRNTDVTEMIRIEKIVPPNSPPYRHYQIPLHHIIRSIMLDDDLYYASSRSHIFNLFFANAQYTNSHFLHLRLLNYLYRRQNYYADIDFGFVLIDEIVENADMVGISRRAIQDSLVKMSRDGLIIFDNQDSNAYAAARFAKITVRGKYYIESLVNKFAYLDLVFQDTPICDMNAVTKLRSKLDIDPLLTKKEAVDFRSERVMMFLDYLEKMEDIEFECNSIYSQSDLTKQKLMRNIMETCAKEMEGIKEEVEEEYL